VMFGLVMAADALARFNPFATRPPAALTRFIADAFCSDVPDNATE
jgi:hypothetical protein